MRVFVYLVLIFNVFYCSESVNLAYRDNKGYISDRDSYHQDVIQHPCASHDVDCIRRVFARSSDCKPVHGPVPDPFILDWFTIHMPHANVTFELKNAQVRGLNDWKIKKFYINRATDKLVLEVKFSAITVYCPDALARYHRKGEEPLELSDYSIVMYKDISLTLTVPNIKDLQLSRAHVYSYILDSNPSFSLGPAMSNNPDHLVSAVYKALVHNISVSLAEIYVQQGPLIMSIFLQNNICDFKKDKRGY